MSDVAEMQAWREDGPLARALAAVVPGSVPGAVLTVVSAVALAAAVTVASPVTPLTAAALAVFVVLAAAEGAPRGRFAWAVVPLLRVGEYGYVIVLGMAADAVPAAYALLALTAFHQYDIVYRLRYHGAPPSPLAGRLALGWDGRLIVLTIAAWLGAFAAAAWVLAAVLGALLLVQSVTRDLGAPPGQP
jgi:hypothetical protein